MLFKENKKLFLYEVDPLFFKDSDDDGFGDFAGFFSKIEYFSYLNVDGVIFPDLFNQEKIILKSSEISIFSKYGKLNDLNKIINWFSKNKINFFIELDLKDILYSNMNQDLEVKKTSEILIKNLHNNEKETIWFTDEKIKILRDILHFWTKQNVCNFVFVNFEHLYKKNSLHNLLTKELLNVYNLTKEINSQAKIGLKSHLMEIEEINYIFNNLLEKICDFFIDNSYSFISTNLQHPRDVFEEFNPRKLIKKINKIKILPKYNFQYIIGFDSKLIGRVSSRWMNENVLHKESIKTLLSMINFLPYSTINYYGNEIGMLRTEISNVNDYYDFDYNERKRKLESNGYSEKKFHYSQKYLSPIHSQSIFSWDTSFNCGFSALQSKLFRIPPINYDQNNVKIQYGYDSSILNFYKKIIFFTNNFFDCKNLLKVKFKWKNNIISYLFYLEDKEILFIVLNPTNKTVNKTINKKNSILMCSYNYKNFELRENIKQMKPYETIVYTNNKIKINDN